MGYEVQTPVFEVPLTALHLILKEEVDLFEVSLSSSSTAISPRLPPGAGRLESHRVPADRGTLVDLKARRLLPGRDDPDSTTSSHAGTSANYSSPACSSARPSRRVAQPRADHADRGALAAARRRPEEPFRSLAPDPLERISLAELAGGRAHRLAPSRARGSYDHVRGSRECREAIETVLGSCRVGLGQLPRSRVGTG